MLSNIYFKLVFEKQLQFFRFKKQKLEPWLLWLSGLRVSSANQRVSGSISSQSTCLGSWAKSPLGGTQVQSHIDVSLPLPPLPLSKNKQIKSFLKKEKQ